MPSLRTQPASQHLLLLTWRNMGWDPYLGLHSASPEHADAWLHPSDKEETQPSTPAFRPRWLAHHQRSGAPAARQTHRRISTLCAILSSSRSVTRRSHLPWSTRATPTPTGWTSWACAQNPPTSMVTSSFSHLFLLASDPRSGTQSPPTSLLPSYRQ